MNSPAGRGFILAGGCAAAGAAILAAASPVVAVAQPRVTCSTPTRWSVRELSAGHCH